MNNILLKVTAYALTRICYRDLDIVENSHASPSIVCNQSFYDETYKECSERITEWVPRILDEIKFQIENIQTYDQEAAFLLQISAFEFKSWDPPKLIRNKYNDDIAGFLLDGKFKDACNEGWILDDKAMNIINHDVHNRVYTLLKIGII